jgi:hypothetical protein
MDWLLRSLVQASVGPVLSFFLSVVVFPLGVGLVYVLYRFTCGGEKDRTYAKLDAPGKVKWVVTQPSFVTNLIFVLVIAAVLGLWGYAQWTLYWQLLRQELDAQKDAQDAENACNVIGHMPGRTGKYLKGGCDNAKSDNLTIEPADQAYRRWFELLFTLWPWADDGAAVAVPFGAGRLFVAILIILLARESLAPTLTSLRGLGNRLFRTAAAA